MIITMIAITKYEKIKIFKQELFKTRNIFKKNNSALLNGSECCNMSLQKEFSILS